jgi:phosphinothricin acetyltransferase
VDRVNELNSGVFEMELTIDFATADDAEQIEAIYAPCVRDTFISFELEPPSASQIRERILKTTEKYPWLVTRRGKEVLAYAYASQHRSRAAYEWSVDVGIYVLGSSRKLGVGRSLYQTLFQVLSLQGFYNAYAGIALPNPASVGLHQACGFRPVGVYENAGFKLGAWRDVGWWQRALLKPILGQVPAAPTWFAEFRDKFQNQDLASLSTSSSTSASA